jgi:hypothetical protein
MSATMGPDPRLERAVLAEMSLRERRAQHRLTLAPAHALAERLHRGDHDLLAHLRAVARRVPERLRPVAWLHHAQEALRGALAATEAGLTKDELRAIELLAGIDPPKPGPRQLARYHAIASAPGVPARIASAVGDVALRDRLTRARRDSDALSALNLPIDETRAS